MTIFYSDTQPGGARMDPSKIWELDGTKHYLGHYDNYMILDAMSKSPASVIESKQVEKEMAICRKKLAWWSRHPKTDSKAIAKGVEERNKLWNKRAA